MIHIAVQSCVSPLAVPGPNTLVGLSKPADAAKPFDHDAAIKALLPAYTELLTQLKALGVPEVRTRSSYILLRGMTCLRRMQ